MKYKIPPKNKYIKPSYNGGYEILLLDKNKNITDTIRISTSKRVVKSKIFAPSNVIKYYWWNLKQRLFWKNSRNILGNFLREKCNLNDTPYLSDD